MGPKHTTAPPVPKKVEHNPNAGWYCPPDKLRRFKSLVILKHGKLHGKLTEEFNRALDAHLVVLQREVDALNTAKAPKKGAEDDDGQMKLG